MDDTEAAKQLGYLVRAVEENHDDVKELKDLLKEHISSSRDSNKESFTRLNSLENSRSAFMGIVIGVGGVASVIGATIALAVDWFS